MERIDDGTEGKWRASPMDYAAAPITTGFGHDCYVPEVAKLTP